VRGSQRGFTRSRRAGQTATNDETNNTGDQTLT
jgi:hypothetical protein